MTDIVELARMHKSLRLQRKANNEAIAQIKRDNVHIGRAMARVDKVLNGDNSARSGLGNGGWVVNSPFFDDKTKKKVRKQKRRKRAGRRKSKAVEKTAPAQKP